MSEDTNEDPNGQSSEAPFRRAAFGKIYDHIDPGKKINIAAFGNISVEIDEENLDLDRVSMESLRQGWEKDAKNFTARCKAQGIEMDPSEVYKYYQIQRKAFQVLGKPAESVGQRRNAQVEHDDQVKLSQMKGNAMCSEYAVLSAYIAQKIGEKVHLVVGSAVESQDKDKWREAHAYVWVDGLNAVFDGVLAQGETDLPAIMQPVSPATLGTLEAGKDIEARRIGSNFSRYYGLEAGGFGLTA